MKCIIYTTVEGSARIGCFEREDGKENLGMALTTPEEHAAAIVAKDPELASWRIGDSVDLPGGNPDGTYDRLFFPEFIDSNPGNQVDVDMAKALARTHVMRRLARSAEMAPLDVQATIPGQAVAAEASRQVVRDRNAQIQADLTAAASNGYDALKAAVLNAPELVGVFRAIGAFK